MKKIYLTFTLLISVLFLNGQNYEYGITLTGINAITGNYQVALTITPDFDQSSPASTADMGLVINLPSNLTIGNFRSGDTGIQPFEWSALQEVSYDGGTTDLIQLYRQEFIPNTITHTAFQTLTLVLFDVIPETGGNPTSGELLLSVDYTDGGTGNTYESYLNVDLTGGNTQDYFSNFDPGADSINFGTLSTTTNSLENLQVSVYPNPTPDILNIASTNKSVNYSLFNILGQNVKINGTVNNNSRKSINISHLPDGVYLLKLEDENNLKTKKTFKIIKKK